MLNIHCSKLNNNSLTFRESLCLLVFISTIMCMGRKEWVTSQRRQIAVRNIIWIISESIRKLPQRGLSCKKLKMGNICPRDKFFTQYLVCLLRDYSFNFRTILLTDIINLNNFSSANCRLHSKKEQKKQKHLQKEKNTAWVKVIFLFLAPMF